MPDPPLHYLERTDVLCQLKEMLLHGGNEKIGITGVPVRVGVQGMGGIGKSVLATALAYDNDIRQHFKDGVIWISIGRNPAITDLQEQIAFFFKDQFQTFENPNHGKHYLSKLFYDKACLLILDDVWNAKDASFLNVIGADCRILITTRNENVLNSIGAKRYSLNVLTEDESIRLLRQASEIPEDKRLPPEASEIVKECGYLPLAITMIGAMVRGKPQNRWTSALSRLKNSELEEIRNYEGEPELFKAIHVSVEALQSDYQEIDIQARYMDFAVFPENWYIPEAVFDTFWADENLKRYKPFQIIDIFIERSLAHRGYQDGISLHDLQFDYVRKQAGDLKPIHNRLVEAYAKKCTNGWASCQDDMYYHKYLIHHLTEAGRTEKAKQAAKELLLGISGIHPIAFFRCVKFLDNYELSNIAKALIKDKTAHVVVILCCLKTLGEKAMEDAKRLIKESQNPLVISKCLDILKGEAKEDAKRLIKESNNKEVLHKCWDILKREEEKEDAKRLIKESKEQQVICRCLDLLKKDTKEDAKRLIKENESHEVLCKCLEVLGDEAKEDAKRLIKNNKHPFVLCRCLELLKEEAKDDARCLIKDTKDHQALCKCLEVLGEEAKVFAIEKLNIWKKAHPFVIVRCFQIAKDLPEAQIIAKEMMTSWEHISPFFRSVALRNSPDSPLRTQYAEEVLSDWQAQNRRLVGAALSVYYNNPDAVTEHCLAILKRWKTDILFQTKKRLRRYDGHIIKSLAHPRLRKQSKYFASEMLAEEAKHPGFLTSELHRIAQNIMQDQWHPWSSLPEEDHSPS